MKNIIVTVVVFSFIFILVLVGAFLLQEFNFVEKLEKADTMLQNGATNFLNNNETKNFMDNLSTDKSITENIINEAKEAIIGAVKDNITEEMKNFEMPKAYEATK